MFLGILILLIISINCIIEIEKLVERVGILEESKTKFTGIMIGINAIILIVAWLIKNAFIK